MIYPLKFRQKVLEVHEREGLTTAVVASRLGVGVALVVGWLNDPAPKTTRNKPATKIDTAAIVLDFRDYPDAYHYERATRLGVSRMVFACDEAP